MYKIYALYGPKKYKRNKLCTVAAAADAREIQSLGVTPSHYAERAAKVIFRLRSSSGVNEAVMLGGSTNPVRPKRAASRPFRCEFRPQPAIRSASTDRRLNGGESVAIAAELIDLDGYK